MLERAWISAVHRHEGVDAQAAACRMKRHFPTLPISLLSADLDLPELMLWLADQYVMKGEATEGLARIIERAAHCGARSHAKSGHGPPRGEKAA